MKKDEQEFQYFKEKIEIEELEQQCEIETIILSNLIDNITDVTFKKK